jgi:hypothetical protein
MWTTKQANISAKVLGALSYLIIIAYALRAIGSGKWSDIAPWAIFCGLLLYQYLRRRSKKAVRDTDLDAYSGRAGDERDASIQLRAWAMVGQVALAVAAVLTAADIVGYIRQPLAFAAFVALAAVHFGSVFAMRFHG